jgi:prepilin-type N-terminal cleavage/methylation domain-containing protein
MRSFLQSLRFHLAAWNYARLRAKRFQQYGVPARPGMVFGPARSQRGFTLIELLVSIAVVAILAGTAAYAYSGFTNNAKASEAIQLADGVERTVVDAFQANGLLPNSEQSAGMMGDVIGKYTDLAMYDSGTIVATFLPNAPAVLVGKTLQFKPYLTSDGVTLTFVCGYHAPPTGATVPANDGTNGGGPSPGTSVSPAYIPRDCRI